VAVVHVNLNKPQENLGELLCIIICNICPQIWRYYCHWLMPYSCEWQFGLAYEQHFTYDSVWAIQFILRVVYICSRSQFCILCTVHIKIECVWWFTAFGLTLANFKCNWKWNL